MTLYSEQFFFSIKDLQYSVDAFVLGWRDKNLSNFWIEQFTANIEIKYKSTQFTWKKWKKATSKREKMLLREVSRIQLVNLSLKAVKTEK